MMGREGLRGKGRRGGAVTVSVSSAPPRLRRWLVVPATLAGVLPAVLLGAAPARAAGGCNLHYWWTPFDSTSSRADAVLTNGSAQSCTMSPAIARFNGGTEIVTTWQSQAGYYAFRNTDGAPRWSRADIQPSATGTAGAPSLISYGGGVEYALPFGNGVYGNDLWYGWMPSGDPGLGGHNQVSTGLRLAPWAPGIARSSGATVLAAAGFDYSLWFYCNTDGSPAWGPEQVAGTWKAIDAPSVTAGYGGVQISAIGPGGSLWFYWAYDGTSTWHPQELSGPGTTFASPAMTTSSGTYELASLTQ